MEYANQMRRLKQDDQEERLHKWREIDGEGVKNYLNGYQRNKRSER